MDSVRHNDLKTKRIKFSECYIEVPSLALDGKTCVNGHSKIDKTKILMTDRSLMQVEVLQNALEHSAILLTCIKR